MYAATTLFVLQMGVMASPLGATERVPLKLLAFGDSLIHGYGLAAADTLPAQLEMALQEAGYVIEVLNGGNSGDTTASGLARLDWSLAEQPDLVLLALGANDGLRGLEPVATAANLDAMLTELEQRGIPVLLAGMLAPRNLGADYAAEFDNLYPRLAEKHAVALYPFLLEGVALDPALNQADGIHPNAKGVTAIVEGLVPHLTPLLDRLDAKTAGE
ncbi:MAG: arylesterase [Kiloniellales bacterium]